MGIASLANQDTKPYPRGLDAGSGQHFGKRGLGSWLPSIGVYVTSAHLMTADGMVNGVQMPSRVRRNWPLEDHRDSFYF